MAGSAADSRTHRYHNRRFERALLGMDLLLDAFAVVDCGVAQAIAHRGQTPACGPNCYQCCIQPIPSTPSEILGLRIFMQLQLASAPESEVWKGLVAAFAQFKGDGANLGAACPFLHEGRCAVYAVQDMGCRRVSVYELTCAEGEDPTTTRPHQVLQPGQDSLQAALRHTLPWYHGRYPLPAKPTAAEAQAFFRSVTTILQAVPWAQYA